MSDPEVGRPAAVRFEGGVPILRVHSLETSLDHYLHVLGFTLDWQDPGIMAGVSRERCSIMLCEADQGHPGTWVWIGVSDAAQLYQEYRRSGATIRHPPTNYWWAYEMQVEDPDGHVLRFGSEPKRDEPTGEWLDGHGDRWVMSPEGKWMRVENAP